MEEIYAAIPDIKIELTNDIADTTENTDESIEAQAKIIVEQAISIASLQSQQYDEATGRDQLEAQNILSATSQDYKQATSQGHLAAEPDILSATSQDYMQATSEEQIKLITETILSATSQDYKEAPLAVDCESEEIRERAEGIVENSVVTMQAKLIVDGVMGSISVKSLYGQVTDTVNEKEDEKTFEPEPCSSSEDEDCAWP